MGMDLQNYSIQNDDECEKVSVFFHFFFNFSLFVFLIQSENIADRYLGKRAFTYDVRFLGR